ncbi:hypothetical protein HYT52_04280 [Candidatus Woesearchaeota archaeon]|nr:hypothetical protein [Candidatus Woesearchaeota archaeon]
MAIETKKGVNNFVSTMLTNAASNQETKAQTRHDDVKVEDIDKIMQKIKKGNFR